MIDEAIERPLCNLARRMLAARCLVAHPHTGRLAIELLEDVARLGDVVFRVGRELRGFVERIERLLEHAVQSKQRGDERWSRRTPLESREQLEGIESARHVLDGARRGLLGGI